MQTKGEIRLDIKKKLKAFSYQQILIDSQKIHQQLLMLDIITNAQSIALYVATNYEVQTFQLIEFFLQKNKNVYLPKIVETGLELRLINSLNQLNKGPYSLLEPSAHCPVFQTDKSALDAIVIPCIAIDRLGNRIGHGKGYYDKLLASLPPTPKICLSFNEQLLEQISAEKHDIPLDIIISPQETIFCKKKTKIIDGKALSQKLIKSIHAIIQDQTIKACLGVIQVGDNPASTLYVTMKKKACEEIGITVEIIHFAKNTTQQDVINAIKHLNQCNDITGILIQLPLPSHLETETLINLIDPLKDIDGLTAANRKKLKEGKEELVCCTPKGILKILEMSNISLVNKKICLVGNGFLVGNPLASMLENRKINFTICDKKTTDIKTKTKDADIVITATGVPHLINHNYLKYGAIVIDAGTAKHGDKVVGDVHFEQVVNKVEKITPVPGGVGPMTIAILMENIIEAYKLQTQIKLAKNKAFFSSIAIVTSQESWFLPYAQKLEQSLKSYQFNAKLFFNYEDINNNPDIVFLLSYFIPPNYLPPRQYKINLLIHESDISQGYGWAPLFWQILEGNNNIPIVLLEAFSNTLAPTIYLKDTIVLSGNELHEEIREMQAKKTLELCYNFLCNYQYLKPQSLQKIGKLYPRRTPESSELDPSKTLLNLFNQLRIANNENYPAFFYHKGTKYFLRINKEKK